MSQLKFWYLTHLVVCLRNYTLGATVHAESFIRTNKLTGTSVNGQFVYEDQQATNCFLETVLTKLTNVKQRCFNIRFLRIQNFLLH